MSKDIKSSTDFDAKLKNDVHFLPWVGEEYENGIAGFDENGIIQYGEKDKPGKRVLVLGESHYCANKSDATPDITRDVIEDFLDPSSVWEPYKNTYTKFERALAGKEFDAKSKIELWKHIAFYNYVQEPMTGARFAPTDEQYHNSEEVFWNVLEVLSPDYIIVWGIRLYNHLPEDGYDYPDDFPSDIPDIWVYNINNKNTFMMPIYHPSVGFDWKFWHDLITFLWKLN